MTLVAVVPCRYDAAHELREALIERGFDGVYTMTDEGLGPAYLKAWDYIAKDAPEALAVHIDVGHDPSETGHLVAAYERWSDDIVIGSRFCAGGAHTGNRKRKVASKLASRACSWAVLHDFHDWSSGLRTYSPHARQVLRDYPFTTRGHAWQIEALWAGWQRGLQVREVPIHYKAGHTSLNRQRAWEACRLLQKMVWSSPPSSVMRLTP